MENKKINRRKFLITSAKSAAGLGLLAGCDKRTVLGLDTRAPSAPVGLAGTINVNMLTATLTWTAHDLTDNTGSKTETGIKGYNIYRDGKSIAPLVQGTTFIDNSGLAMGTAYTYTLTAVDMAGNESLDSKAVFLPMQKESSIYVVTNPAAATGTPSRPAINATVVKKMVQDVVMQVTGQTTVAAAFESLFPVLSAATLIGLKINTLGANNVSTKVAVVEAIVDGLTQMQGGTFPAYNIIVFDDRGKDSHMKPAGYILRDEPGLYRIASTNWNTTLHGTPIVTQETEDQLWGNTITMNGISQKITTIFDAVDYIINVPVIKDHSLSGITFSMKNFYGIIHNPPAIHGNMCSPYIPWVYNTIKDKVKLVVGDAIVTCANGGPSGPATHILNTIVAGKDPIALDSWALKTINSKKSTKAQVSFSPEGDARYIYAASLTPYELGSTNVITTVVPA
jgi:uncharacterized protein (DUF362 family)